VAAVIRHIGPTIDRRTLPVTASVDHPLFVPHPRLHRSDRFVRIGVVRQATPYVLTVNDAS
jgi:hypothetical protein